MNTLPRTLAFAAAVVISSASWTFAGPHGSHGSHGSRYALKHVPQGGSRFTQVLVRTHRGVAAERPYALTGEHRPHRVVRHYTRPTPSHPKGTHTQP